MDKTKQFSWVSRYVAGGAMGLKRFLVVAVPVVICLILMRLDLLSGASADIAQLIIAPMLFILGIPVSIMLRVDEIRYWLPWPSVESVLLVALLIAALNIFLLGGFWRLVFGGRGKGRTDKKKEPHKPAP